MELVPQAGFFGLVLFLIFGRVLTCPGDFSGDISAKFEPETVLLELEKAACQISSSSCQRNTSSESNPDSVIQFVIQSGSQVNFQPDLQLHNLSIFLITSESDLNLTICHPNYTAQENVFKLPQNATFDLSSGLNTVVLEWEGCQAVWRLNVSLKGIECDPGDGSSVCSSFGTCLEDQGSYSCQCCPGYKGKFCQEKDGCYKEPCKHGGFCVDVDEGLDGESFRCLCPHGYGGKTCEEIQNPCEPNPCLNNGSCSPNNQTGYQCSCTNGYIGRNCEMNVNECASNPCLHGVCEDGDGTFRCYCLPGYGGDLCEFEYDECDSNPCLNGGVCEDLVAGFQCHCGPGYRGRRCQVKVDLCRPNPCPVPARCLDRGHNYSCVCQPGYGGPGCSQKLNPCYPNPCQHSGTCRPHLDTYSCACQSGFSGDICQEILPPSLPTVSMNSNNHNVQHVTTSSSSLDSVFIAAYSLAGICLIILVIISSYHCGIWNVCHGITHKPPRLILRDPQWERF